MARVVAVATLLILVFSGCMGGAKEPAAILAGDAEAPTESQQIATPNGPTQFSFNATELEFTDSITRFEIVAFQDATIVASLEVALSQYGLHEGCVAAALSAPERAAGLPLDAADMPAAAIVAYKMPDDPDHPRIRAGAAELDENIVGGPLAGNEGELQRMQKELELVVHAGERLLVEIGGSSNDVLGAGDASVRIKSSGALSSRRLPDAGIRCGTTWFQTGSAAANLEGPTRLGEVVVGAFVSLETESASTAVLRFDTAGLLYGTGRLDFVDKRIPFERSHEPGRLSQNGNILEASMDTGRLSFTVDHWVAIFPGYAGWLLVDAYWPVVEFLTPLPIE